MKEVKGDIWDYYNKGNWIVITTNGTIKANGEAVMGKGIALQARERFPNLPKELGRKLRVFGLTPIAFHSIKILTFPVKLDWWQNSSLSLIEEGCKSLVEHFSKLNTDAVYMVRPGCGNGQLDWEEVKPILEAYLDDRFIVVNYEGNKSK